MAESVNLLTFIKEYGTLLVAAYGVIQIWIISLWKNLFTRGKLSIFKAGRLEVGYSTFGPSIAINGTLRALRKDVFVTEVDVEIQKKKDRSTHLFEWTAFRSNKLRITPNDPVSLELASGFLVRVGQPYKYHIFLSDRPTREELEPSLIELREKWQMFLAENSNKLSEAIQQAQFRHENFVESLFVNDFSKNAPVVVKTWDLMNRKNYWDAGEYLIRIIAKVASPNKSIIVEGFFSLTEKESELLKLNSIATIRELCLGQVNYSFAFPEYNLK